MLLLTTRGIPCLYYGCEQYLYSNLGGGEDPYNRPMMESWKATEARRLITLLADARRCNPALQWGGVWPIVVEKDVYVYLRRYKKSRCLVILNRGGPRELTLQDLEMADGTYACLLTDQQVTLQNGGTRLLLQGQDAIVLNVCGEFCEACTVVNVQVNGVPIYPGDRVAVVGDVPELGAWDLAHVQFLECVNGYTWFGEVAINASAGRNVAYKYVVLKPDSLEHAKRENRAPRRRTLPQKGASKWRDQWEG